ncbi:MAG: family 43 glycosylhydrolase [Bacteroidales bacterium]|nr:family 43 glycosylhydrolase [Bacteroidales bacterium]MBR5073012.1 family 43 glycosylhydrolase [Bacteroidales bacterium]
MVANPIDLNYVFHVEDSDESLLSVVPEEYLSQVTPEQREQLLAVIRKSLGGNDGAREAADPVVQIYKDRYYLFPSKSKGYWSSEDMQHWVYIPCQMLPIELYAPTVMVYKDELYWMVSDINELYKTSNPEDGTAWELVTDRLVLYPDQPERTGHDPDLFPDDDGSVYLYWGCSDVDVISGIQLDPENSFAPIGREVVLITHREKEFGWEQPGDKNEKAAPGYNEGPNIFKNDGKYYLHYAAPGTEYDSYGDGLYVSDSPLGPFEHVEYSPVSVKPGGWMTGAGHGDTFRDKYGNWWHVASTVISQRMNFERRIGFFPMVCTPKGHFYALTEWSDYPYVLPDGPQDFSVKAPWTGWMDLSIHKKVKVSSELDGYEAAKAADNSIKTWWSAVTGDPGEWVCVDLGKTCRINAVQTNFADQDFGYYDLEHPQTPYRYVVEVSKDGNAWRKVFDRSDAVKDNPHELLVLSKAVKARYVRVRNLEELTGKFSVFDLRVFGLVSGKKPDAVTGLRAERGEDTRRIRISWPASEGAQGYVLRWGTDPDELYLTCQSEVPEVELGLFSVGQSYYFRVDAFNESGVTPGREQILCE